MANLQIIISALNKSSGDLHKVKTDIKDVGNAGKDAKGGVTGFADGIGSILGKAALVAGSVAAVATALKEVYETVKEGAELEYARTRFDNLAESIGTVSDALLSDLKDATGGMMSDAELVAGAADFMALGLAKSHDEVVRLTSVAGALGMNMNQLVLTLTNQTTMRFDALGVSVDGFDAKVKALEASGMSASEAFSEAFLQQAEEQIKRVGAKSETSAGQIQIMESAWKNLGDAIKLTMADALDGIAPAMTSLANHMTENINTTMTAGEVNQQMAVVMGQLKDAVDAGVITALEYRQLQKDINYFWTKGANDAEDLALAQDLLNRATGVGTDGTVTYTDAITAGKAQLALMAGQVEELTEAEMAAAVEALVAAGDYEMLGATLGITAKEAKKVIKAWEDSAAAHAKMIAQLENVTSLEGNYRGIIDLAYKYTDMLEEKENLQIERQKLISQGWWDQSKKIKDLDQNIADLDAQMAELADKVVLDMFQATIAIGGVTESELSAYMQMAIDMGLMSEEGAQAALDAYGNAIKTINGYELDEKTGNINFDAQQAFDMITMINAMEIADKNGNIDMFIRYYGTSGGYDPYENYEGPGTAVGGSVNAGNPYTWQEYGYRGEVFVPSADGFVLSRADAERALAKALYGGGSAVDPEAIGRAVAQAMSGVTARGKGGNVYNLTMPTSSNPADVRTAFELMEAWA